jgi:hypothetical protein
MATKKPAVPRRPRMPNGLGSAGQRLWNDVLDEFDLSAEPHKRRILADACRIADYVKRMDDAAVKAPLLTKGSMGQEVIHPLIDKAITARGQLAQLLARLNFAPPDDDEDE